MLNPREVRTIEDAKRIVEERQLTHVKVGLFDIDGVMLGKYMRRNKFFSALEHGFAFCDVILGWDSKDKLYDNVKYTGWHTGYPDAQCELFLQPVVKYYLKKINCCLWLNFHKQQKLFVLAGSCVV